MHTYKELQEKVQQLFSSENFIGTPPRLYEPIDYTLSLGGKRIRPVLLLAATDLFDGDLDTVSNAAIGIETFHNFTLLHDDLMDKSPIRRGKDTVYRKWDENTAILSGDAMNILAWRYFLKQPHENLHQILCTFEKTSMEICEGQQYDMDFEKNDNVSIIDYMEMIRLKTAVLIAGALKIGALYANADNNDIEHLYRFGISIGLAFQLRDDLLDVYGDPAVFGKAIGGDITSNKKTYMLINAFNRANPTQLGELKRWVEATQFDREEKVRAVTGIYDEIGIRQLCEQKINYYFDECRKCLAQVSVSADRKQMLLDYTDEMMTRRK